MGVLPRIKVNITGSNPTLRSDNIVTMNCPIADVLLDEYFNAVMEYFDAADKLANLQKAPNGFAEAHSRIKQAGVKCRGALLEFQSHRLEHECMTAV